MSRSPASKKYLRRGLILLLSTFVVVIGGEIMIRVCRTPHAFPPLPAPSTIDPYQTNPYVVRFRPFLYSHIPHARYTQARSYYQVDYRINARGYRGAEIPAKQAGRPRLLVLGDSVTEGHGCAEAESYPSLLQQRLADAGWEVINAGVQGASPLYYAANLPRYLALQPDAVLLTIFENDVYGDRMLESSYFDLGWLDDTSTLLGHSRVGRQSRDFWCSGGGLVGGVGPGTQLASLSVAMVLR